MFNTNLIWTEKYRPRKLEDLILPAAIKERFAKDINAPLLLHGTAGTGKTSFAKILANPKNLKFINCSQNSSVEDVRNDLISFCSSASFSDDGKKFVVFDEFEGVSDQYFKALRGVMETYVKTTVFIATTNYINKIPDSVQSRFECLHFNFTEKDEREVKIGQMKRVRDILKMEGMTIENDALKALLQNCYPDMRRVINLLQSFNSKGIFNITANDVTKNVSDFSELFNRILTKQTNAELFSHIFKEYSNFADEVFISLGREFPKYLIEIGKGDMIGDVCVKIQEYVFQSRTSLDKVQELWCCIYSINKMLV
jgi:DNA polymerase III delta prime subunit